MVLIALNRLFCELYELKTFSSILSSSELLFDCYFLFYDKKHKHFPVIFLDKPNILLDSQDHFFVTYIYFLRTRSKFIHLIFNWPYSFTHISSQNFTLNFIFGIMAQVARSRLHLNSLRNEEGNSDGNGKNQKMHAGKQQADHPPTVVFPDTPRKAHF